MKDIINIIGHKDKEMEINYVPLTLDRFNIKKRIAFIDRVLKFEYSDWSLEEAISIRVKKGEDAEVETEEVERKYLEGINDAILNGHNLRTNPFVKQCERSGYYFPSIIIKMVHKREPYKINLEVQFKFRPDMPEISIEESYIIEKEGDTPYVLTPDFRKDTLNKFIHDIFSIYDKLSIN